MRWLGLVSAPQQTFGCDLAVWGAESRRVQSVYAWLAQRASLHSRRLAMQLGDYLKVRTLASLARTLGVRIFKRFTVPK